MEIVYKKLTEEELDTFVDMRIRQLTEEYTTEGREVPENVDLKSALFGQVTELAGGSAAELDLYKTPNSEQVKGELRIVEIDFLTYKLE